MKNSFVATAHFMVLFCFLASFCHALEVEDAEKFPFGGGKIIFNESFDGNSKPDLPEYFSVAGNEGTNGTSALKLSCFEPKRLKAFKISLPQMDPNLRHKASLQVRSEGLNHDDVKQTKIVICAIEYYDKEGKIQAVDYPIYTPGTDYTAHEFAFTPRPDLNAKFLFYLWYGWMGTIWFDDLVIKSEGPDISALLTWPSNMTFRLGDGQFKIRVDPKTPRPFAVLMTAEQAGHKQKLLLYPDENSDCRGVLENLQSGSALITARILDTSKQVFLYEGKFNVMVLPHEESPSNAAVLDEHGRLIVGGKPFMPLGVFGLYSERDLKFISKAGFNCVMVYSSFTMSGNIKTGNAVEDIRSGLDLFQQYQLKLLFALNQQLPGYKGITDFAGVKGLLPVAEKAVSLFKNHPALLGWYVSDEVSRPGIPDVIALRELVNRTDPWHPTWTLTYRREDIPYYGTSGDVMGVDPYCIEPAAETQKLDRIIVDMEAANTTGLPVWVVPQIFNWGIYRSKTAEEFAKTRGPSMEEMRTMPLLCAIMGAKGFIFYSQISFFFWAEKLIPGTWMKEWPKVEAMAAVMKSLEPFILSLEKAPEVNVQTTPDQRVRARAFKCDDGRIRVVIVSMDSANHEAVLHVPGYDNLKSEFGLCKNLGHGKYLFSVKGINSDILEND